MEPVARRRDNSAPGESTVRGGRSRRWRTEGFSKKSKHESRPGGERAPISRQLKVAVAGGTDQQLSLADGKRRRRRRRSWRGEEGRETERDRERDTERLIVIWSGRWSHWTFGNSTAGATLTLHLDGWIVRDGHGRGRYALASSPGGTGSSP